MNKTSLTTVNVIEKIDGEIRQVISFPDDETGNKHAKQVVSTLLNETNGNVDNITLEEVMDYGHYKDDNGYSIFIVHSNVINVE